MKAERLRDLADEIDRIISDAPQLGHANEVFSMWASEVRGLLILMRHIESNPGWTELLTPSDQIFLTRTLHDLDFVVGDVDGSARDTSRTLRCIGDLGTLLRTLANRIKDDTAARVGGEFLREAGVLVATFGMLDKYLEDKSPSAAWIATVLGLGFVFVLAGGIIERLRR